jgi:hypothetical protein
MLLSHAPILERGSYIIKHLRPIDLPLLRASDFRKVSDQFGKDEEILKDIAFESSV